MATILRGYKCGPRLFVRPKKRTEKKKKKHWHDVTCPQADVVQDGTCCYDWKWKTTFIHFDLLCFSTKKNRWILLSDDDVPEAQRCGAPPAFAGRWSWTWSLSFQWQAQSACLGMMFRWSAGLPHLTPDACRKWWGGVDVGGTGTRRLRGWSALEEGR